MKTETITVLLLLFSVQVQNLKIHLLNPRSDEDVSFDLYTQKNPDSTPIVIGDETTLKNLNPGNPTKIIVHGFATGPSVMDSIKEEFLKSTQESNIIMMDWSKLAISLNAMANRIPAGETLAKLIDFLVSVGVNTADIELIGFSLGGHVIGIGANRATSGRIGRLTGVDPVGQGFENENIASEDRLDESDGDFLEVIHTSTLGWSAQLGHADFFINDGQHQPGCTLDLTGLCSHLASIDVYAKSINDPDSYIATACSDYQQFTDNQCVDNPTAPLGPTTPISTRGSFYLATT